VIPTPAGKLGPHTRLEPISEVSARSGASSPERRQDCRRCLQAGVSLSGMPGARYAMPRMKTDKTWHLRILCDGGFQGRPAERYSPA